MKPKELIPNADVVTTWTFTVDVSGNIPETFTADIGHYITVTNASGASYIGNIYALTMSDGDQTLQLIGHESMKVDIPYTILVKGDYYLRTDKAAFLPEPNEGTNGTLRVGGGAPP